MSSYSPPATWTSPTFRAHTRPIGDEPGPGWSGYLMVAAVLGLLALMLIGATPS
ncbi:hypothetical protein [Williamsia muralis]|uniref:hypothetical protein n=1 Tax=Williamsia marianensis TaxID=85044 RepID=UPI0038037903